MFQGLTSPPSHLDVTHFWGVYKCSFRGIYFCFYCQDFFLWIIIIEKILCPAFLCGSRLKLLLVTMCSLVFVSCSSTKPFGKIHYKWKLGYRPTRKLWGWGYHVHLPQTQWDQKHSWRILSCRGPYQWNPRCLCKQKIYSYYSYCSYYYYNLNLIACVLLDTTTMKSWKACLNIMRILYACFQSLNHFSSDYLSATKPWGSLWVHSPLWENHQSSATN